MSRGHYFTAYGRLLVLGLTTACVDVAPEGLNDVSGTYVGHAEIHRDAGARTATATYTLRIANRNGFMHGLWTISGDMAQPTDPWEAVVTGDRSGNWMVLEYHSPVDGRCHLAGVVVSDTYRPEYRCAWDWSQADTLCLTKNDAFFNPCLPPSSNTGRSYVEVNVRYVYGSTSVRVSCEPSDTICFTGRNWLSPHYLWASDSTHMARQVEGILGVENPACSWCGRRPSPKMVYSEHAGQRGNRLDDLSPEDRLTFIELGVVIDSLETSPQLLDPIRELEIWTSQEEIRQRLREFIDSEYNTGGWTPRTATCPHGCSSTTISAMARMPVPSARLTVGPPSGWTPARDTWQSPAFQSTFSLCRKCRKGAWTRPSRGVPTCGKDQTVISLPCARSPYG